jgi:paired amphipathic helix protein Sin3a
MLYNRLESLKLIGKQLSAQKAQLINPLAVELGLNDVGGPSPLLTEGVNPSTHFYEHLLDLCEKLFDNEIDQAFFEETMRHMFGTQAFVSFTLDKLVAVIVKQVGRARGSASLCRSP